MLNALILGALELGIGLLAFLTSRLYVATLLRVANLEGLPRAVALYLAAAVFAFIVVLGPFAAPFMLPSLGQWLRSSLLAQAWLFLCSVLLAIIPSLRYVMDTRVSELRKAGIRLY